MTAGGHIWPAGFHADDKVAGSYLEHSGAWLRCSLSPLDSSAFLGPVHHMQAFMPAAGGLLHVRLGSAAPWVLHHAIPSRGVLRARSPGGRLWASCPYWNGYKIFLSWCMVV
eukprot:TRINITY_DN17592_c0_g1_i1.p2 TRINITY_DN17592_c0_g1~~TRINITY_DN17592_c0_g1_i1.p2  ORF type:complete len:112 (+),score=6.20 TRINITY_DN17592_c0_g1_i1:368-703(+)